MKIPSAIKSIRKFCLECTGDDRDWIRKCPSTSCAIWPYRMGKNPNCVGKPKKKKETL